MKEYYSGIKRTAVLIHAIMQTSLENITLNERSRPQKTTYCLISMYTKGTEQANSEKGDWWLPRVEWLEGQGVVTLRGDEVSFWGYENVLKFTVVMTVQLSVTILKTILNK